jgi:group II intron reverse transcriptase/maturase
MMVVSGQERLNSEGLNSLTQGTDLKMRKRKRQQSKEAQLRLFDRGETTMRPSLSPEGGTIGTRQKESEFLSLLARNRALTGTLLERVMSPTNLNQAYEAVKRNKGAAGIDGMATGQLRAWLGENGQSLIEKVLSDKYEPQAVLGVEIPKANGGTRLLGIPTVVDRMLQQAIHQQLNLLYEPLFSMNSYGFRVGKSAHDAIEQSSEYIQSGYEWVVDIDLKSFFDEINHDRLMQRLSKGIGDKGVLKLIRKFLRSGIMVGGVESQRTSGTPQGGPLSPLLSNIVLDELDKELEKRGHLFCRYADDCNIYVKTEAAGKRVLASITGFIEKKLKLKVNREKSGVRHCSQVKFLGYTIMPQGKIRIADKSLTRFKEKIKQITKRSRGVSFARVVAETNEAIQGWIGYFRLAEIWLPWKNLDGWIRRRLRCYRLKQCGRKYTLFKFLRGLGGGEHQAWNTVIYGGSWWHLSARRLCQNLMGKTWFASEGLHTLEGLYKRFKS